MTKAVRGLWKTVVRKAWAGLDQVLLGLCLGDMGMSRKEARQFLAAVGPGWQEAPDVERRAS